MGRARDKGEIECGTCQQLWAGREGSGGTAGAVAVHGNGAEGCWLKIAVGAGPGSGKQNSQCIFSITCPQSQFFLGATLGH